MSASGSASSLQKKPVRSFSLHWSVVTLWLTLVSTVIVWSAWLGAFTDAARATSIVKGIGINAAACLLLSWIMFLVSRRSRLVASFTFGALVVLSSFLFGLGLTRATSSAAQMKDASKLAKEIRGRHLDALKANDPEASNIAAMETASMLKEQAAQGGSINIALGVIGEFVQETAPIREEFTAATSAFHEAGDVQIPTLQTIEAIESRLGMIERMSKAIEEVAGIDQRAAALKSRMLARGVAPSDAEQVFSDAMSGLRQPQIVRIRELDRVYADNARRVLQIYREYFGKFWVDEAGDILCEESVPDEVVAQFNEATEGMNTAAAEQARLFVELEQIQQSAANESDAVVPKAQ